MPTPPAPPVPALCVPELPPEVPPELLPLLPPLGEPPDSPPAPPLDVPGSPAPVLPPAAPPLDPLCPAEGRPPDLPPFDPPDEPPGMPALLPRELEPPAEPPELPPLEPPDGMEAPPPLEPLPPPFDELDEPELPPDEGAPPEEDDEESCLQPAMPSARHTANAKLDQGPRRVEAGVVMVFGFRMVSIQRPRTAGRCVQWLLPVRPPRRRRVRACASQGELWLSRVVTHAFQLTSYRSCLLYSAPSSLVPTRNAFNWLAMRSHAVRCTGEMSGMGTIAPIMTEVPFTSVLTVPTLVP